MIVHAYTDGASRGNPGDSGIGVLMQTPDGTPLATIMGFIGAATNNAAEYSALLACLKAAAHLPCKQLVVHSDSELMVRHLTGRYKVRDARLKKFVDEVRSLVQGASYRFEIHHVLRGNNAEADDLANRGIDSRKPVHVEWTEHARDLMNVK